MAAMGVWRHLLLFVHRSTILSGSSKLKETYHHGNKFMPFLTFCFAQVSRPNNPLTYQI